MRHRWQDGYGSAPWMHLSGEVHMSALVEECRVRRSLPTPGLAREIRRAADVSQRRMAAELGVHWTTVARWERGERRPRGDMGVAYARLLTELRELAS